MFVAGSIRITASPDGGCPPSGHPNLLELPLTCSNPHEYRFRSLAAFGFNVFPCQHAGKKPVIAWKDRQTVTSSEDELLSWDMSDFNPAVVCGEASNIVILDTDSDEAEQFVQQLDLPVTPTVRTARGFHRYFRPPAGLSLPNAVQIGGRKLDLRGNGGYAIGAGALHESGIIYEWVRSPADVEFAAFPQVLIDLLEAPKAGKRTTRAHSAAGQQIEGMFGRWLRDRLDSAKADLAVVAEGKRNDALFRFAAPVARDVAGANVDWQPFADELAKVALDIGLEPDEIETTLRSARRAGQKEPTPWMVTARGHLYLAKQDVFYHIASGQFLKREGFNNAYASQRVGNTGTLGRFLLDNEYIIIVHDLTYDPALPERLIERDGLLWYNTYRAPLIEAASGDWAPLDEFLAYLIPDTEEREHLKRVIAYTVRNPGKKVRHAILLRSEHQGIGKSMLAGLWKALLGPSNARTVSSEEVASNYQAFLQETLLVVLEELSLGSGRQFYNRMKDWITGDEVRINQKFLTPREWPNLVTFLILTNLRVPILIEDKDRRVFMIDTPATPRPADYYRQFAEWWQSNKGVVRAYFDDVDLNGFDPFAPPPETAAKRTLMADSRTELEKDLALAIEDRLGTFNRDLVTLEQVEQQLGRSVYGKSRTQLMAALKAIGAANLGQMRVSGTWLDNHFASAANQRASLWAIRNVGYWQFASAQACADEYQRHEGLFWPYALLGIDVCHASQWPGDPALLFPKLAKGSRMRFHPESGHFTFED